jgi:hypothetical protein
MTTEIGLWDMLDGWQDETASPRRPGSAAMKKPRGASRDGKTASERVRDGGGTHT